MNTALQQLADRMLLPGTKGMPLRMPVAQRDVAAQGYNVLAGNLSYPVAVLRQSALEHNLAWMQHFAERSHALLAPHGKTTMSPQLFDAQLRAGAWAITLATIPQLQVAYRHGVRRVLLANQPVAPADIEALATLLRDDAGFEAYVLVDSLDGVARLSEVMRRVAPTRVLPVLVELGADEGRTGVRGVPAAFALAQAVARTPGLQLAGIEGYEGLWVTANRSNDLQRVRGLLRDTVQLTRDCDVNGLFNGHEILVSAGGSAYFDLVVDALAELDHLSRPLRRVLRSGCYLTMDHGFYRTLQTEMAQREGAGFGDGLRPALEIWAMVQSRPEPGLALLTLGKRDVSYDIDLPIPLCWHRPGTSDEPQKLQGLAVTKLSDQHAFLPLPDDHPLQVGDLVCVGVSHPCTTFDKWNVVLTVDDAYNVVGAINTFF